jgi:hypothetical protein
MELELVDQIHLPQQKYKILLWFTDYHHFQAPVNGKIVYQGMYNGSYNYDFIFCRAELF